MSAAIEKIVEHLEFCFAGRGSTQDYPVERRYIDALIADWRKRGDAAEEVRAKCEAIARNEFYDNSRDECDAVAK